MAVTGSASIGAGARGEVATIGLISLSHFGSHVMQLALAPVLPLMRGEFGVGYTELGIVLAVFYASSAVGQIVSGILVDRLGARRLLMGGIFLQAASLIGFALAPAFLWLFPLAVLSGLGNSVYHPANLSILSARVSQARLGRGFSAHTIGGGLGFAASPILVGTIATATDWRIALCAAALVGVGVAAALWAGRDHISIERHAAHETAGLGPATSIIAILAVPTVLLGFGYFVLTAISGVGIQTFSISAFSQSYGQTIASGTVAVTLYQVAIIIGVAIGGVVADRLHRPQAIAITGTAIAAVLTAAMALSALPFPVIVALAVGVGLAVSIALPSRDLMVRQAAPPGARGKVFGLVYSGVDAGALIAPLLMGPLLDHHYPEMIFVVAGISCALGAVTLVAFTRYLGPVAGRAGPSRA